MKNNYVLSLRKELKNNIDEKTKNSFQRFFKEKVQYYGVKSIKVNQLAKEYFNQIKHLDKQTIYSLCEELFRSSFGEEAWIAANWVYWLKDKYVEKDVEIFEKWINKYINDWAKCDTLSNHAIGAFIEKFPQYINRLKAWTKSSNRWMKRASAVALILPARHGKFLKDIFEIADKLLLDKDDMVQKGYGWMLKEASKSHQKEVFEYIIKNQKIMPRTALRYAIEKMPPKLKKQAMAKN